MIKCLSCVLLITLSAPSHEQDFPPSPCPDIFQYETVTEQTRWYGRINLTADSPIYSLWLNIELDEKADILGNWIGDVSSTDNKDFKIENSEVKVVPGAPTSIRFFVQYDALKRAPKLKTIRFNGREICNADYPISATKPSTERPIPVTEKPYSYEETNESRPPTNAEDNNYNQEECGMVLRQSANPLVASGRPTYEGAWPWQIALYQTDKSRENFICGGTLVTHRHVVTAAHCVTKTETSRPSADTILTVYLGKFNLQTSVQGVQKRFVTRIISHPEYMSSNFMRDVAIIVLHKPVAFTEWVQPACMWPEEYTGQEIIVGKRGSVVGWGYDDTGELSQELMLAEMPVVDTVTCLRSHRQFFVQYTSDYTYCAGYRNGTSVCNGDSGGGMVFRINGAWHLRGIVSLSVKSHNLLLCDPKHYVIFTDVAQFLPWIHQYIS